MIYEILVRAAENKKLTSDHLIWIETELGTREFEKWMRDRALLDASGKAPVVRWGIVQTQRAAHFKLATQAKALKTRISELMSGLPEVTAMQDASKALSAIRARVKASTELAAAH
ncbi:MULTISPECIES: hypothetical protein [Undibacterium]|jgi:hypothetical protein|uniref:Uncharacterized protein n=2 Tax=Undibacterium TaxID=401469 RepID=A0A941I6J8_9BURK|nr:MULTISPECIES: hypothetical protein [Undibacterium]MBR7783972.1 hypothetical protein [Undibacterium luofuense]GGX52767.1 hypothetical protein GCM10010946_34340 [Undibacterium squillarum]